MARTINSFSELAEVLGVKTSKTRNEKPIKCPNCGGSLRQVEGTNIYACDFHKLENKALNDGSEVQVFSKCSTTIIGSKH